MRTRRKLLYTISDSTYVNTTFPLSEIKFTETSNCRAIEHTVFLVIFNHRKKRRRIRLYFSEIHHTIAAQLRHNCLEGKSQDDNYTNQSWQAYHLQRKEYKQKLKNRFCSNLELPANHWNFARLKITNGFLGIKLRSCKNEHSFLLKLLSHLLNKQMKVHYSFLIAVQI